MLNQQKACKYACLFLSLKVLTVQFSDDASWCFRSHGAVSCHTTLIKPTTQQKRAKLRQIPKPLQQKKATKQAESETWLFAGPKRKMELLAVAPELQTRAPEKGAETGHIVGTKHLQS